MSRQGKRSWAARIAAAVVVVLTLVTTAAALLTAQHIQRLAADRDARALAGQSIIPIVGVISSAVDAAGAGSMTSGRQVPVDRVEQAGVPGDAAVRARDTGSPVVNDTDHGLIVAATYDDGATPTSVEERRRQITGYRIVPLELTSALNARRPAGGGIAVNGPERTVLSLPGSAPADAAPYTVQLSQRLAPDWTLTVWTAPEPIPWWVWIATLLLVVVGLGTAAWLLRIERVAQDGQHELEQLREQSAALAGLTAVAQHSLDLSDVLPAVTTELSQALGLRGLTLGSPTPMGDRLYFAWGEPPGVPVSMTGIPSEVQAGETVATVLSRGGRTVARLTVLAGRHLDTHDAGTLVAAADILTSAVANAEAFAQQREVLQRMRSVDELKTVFLATASHELRTPVGVITGYARILSKNWDNLSAEQGRTFADRVDTNAQRLGSLVEDLLDFSRLERGVGVAGEGSVLDLGEVVSRMLDQQPDLASTHDLSHRTVRGLGVMGSPQAVERVVTNLVGNAAKYSPAGTAIRVLVSEKRGRAELVVEDDGPGVPAAEREQIFSRFFRGRGEAVVNTRGAGLGLAIVSEFAASMGGQVSVSAADSGGARFVVSYPLAGPKIDPTPEPVTQPVSGPVNQLNNQPVNDHVPDPASGPVPGQLTGSLTESADTARGESDVAS